MQFDASFELIIKLYIRQDFNKSNCKTTLNTYDVRPGKVDSLFPISNLVRGVVIIHY